jgi:PAS domain
MLLWDPRLKFARDLIAQWIHIRRKGLVPFEEDLDLRTLIPMMSFVTITAVAQPNAAIFEVVSPQISRRWGRDMRRADLFDFIAPERRSAAEKAKRLFISVPCGAYYRYALSSEGRRVVEAEALSLPLRHRGETAPSVSISLTRGVEAICLPDVGSAAMRQIERIFAEFVDIGAGAPAFPSAAPD